MDGQPSTTVRNRWLQLPLRCLAELNACLNRIESWRTPPNWSPADWREEIDAVAILAAWEAECGFDPARGTTPDAFVRSRVLGRALAQYRREWAFGLHWAEAFAESEKLSKADRAGPFAAAPSHDLVSIAMLGEAMAQLAPQSRWLLQQLFWEERSEAEIGHELGISQRAVSKRKQVALNSLRRNLNG